MWPKGFKSVMWAPEGRILKPQFCDRAMGVWGNLFPSPRGICCRVWCVSEGWGKPHFCWGSGIPLLCASLAAHWGTEAVPRCVPVRGIPGMFQLPPILRGQQPGAAAASLLLIPHGAKSGTSPLRSVVLPSHKATVGKADYPRPDVAFCSRCGAGKERVSLSAPPKLFLGSCLHLSFSMRIWESQPAFIDCLPYFFRSSVLLFLSTGPAP